MNFQHQRKWDDVMDWAHLMDKFRVAGSPRKVELPRGSWKGQKDSSKCAAYACRNALETADHHVDFPVIITPTQDEIFNLAKERINLVKATPREIMSAMAEATCELVGDEIRWMELPLDPVVFKAWLAVEKTGIAYGTVWTGGDAAPTGYNLIPTTEQIGPGHAVHIHGYDDNHSWRRFFWQARRPYSAFMLENSHRFGDSFFYQQSRVLVHGLVAVVFLPPSY